MKEKGFISIFLGIFLLVILFVGTQFIQYNQEPISAGGDWNYGVNVPWEPIIVL